MPGLGKLTALLREAMPEKWPYVNLFPYRVPAGAAGHERLRRVRSHAGEDHRTAIPELRQLLAGGWRNAGLFLYQPGHRPAFRDRDQDSFLELHSGKRPLQLHGAVRMPLSTSRRTPRWRMAAGESSTLRISRRKSGTTASRRSISSGKRTATWEMLRRINSQIHALAPTLIRLHSTGVYHYPDVPEQGQPLGQSKLIEAVDMTQRIRPSAGGRPISGRRVRGRGPPAVFPDRE